ncbi:hypothetical protein J2Y66_003766 [Paenarthrobacter nitroguajacolicus]|nr:hypothetical protein [Paenarthrobacter nitroguajacolicus]
MSHDSMAVRMGVSDELEIGHAKELRHGSWCEIP